MFRSEGYIFCPRCFDKREFVPTPDAADHDRYPPIECVECGYEFSKVTQEDPAGGPPQVVEALPREVRDTARAEYAEEFSRNVARSGYRLRASDRAILNGKGNT